MQYDVLRSFAERDGAQILRLNSYIRYDQEKASLDTEYKTRQYLFQSRLRDLGYKVIPKNVQWYKDDQGVRYGKANADLDLAVDVLQQAENLDKVILLTGDGDFTKVITAIQNKGCRVEVIAFDNVSASLKEEADLYMSGYLIPNLLPIKRCNKGWGNAEGYARGTCVAYQEGYGFIRYLKHLNGELWITDSREQESPYETIFFHHSELPDFVDSRALPNRSIIFEFQIHKRQGEDRFRASEVIAYKART